MIRNYLKVAVRNIMKYKFFSAINIMGMTIGLTACLLIVLYVSDELSYDRFHEHANAIYQMNLDGRISGQELRTSVTCPPLAHTMVNEIPDVAEATRIGTTDDPVIKYNDKAFTEKKVFFADSNFFSFFSFKLLEGDPATVLKEPNTAVLTIKTVKKYFGDEDPIGKLITVGNKNTAYKVTGIAADCPGNSHIKYHILLSSVSNEDMRSTFWLNNFLYTYIRLNENGSMANVEEKLRSIVVKYVGPEVEKVLHISMKDMLGHDSRYGFFGTKITDIHLRSATRDSIEPPGNMMYVYFFGSIAIFIIVIACINFMNLATARSAGRAKEIGLRKTLGSLRGQMIVQFLAESVIYSFAAVVLAVMACYFLLPVFNIMSGKELGIASLFKPSFIAGMLVMIIVVGLIAGSYPAFYLTSFNAVEVLKGKVRAGMKSKGVRSVLVVFQFAISIFLIIFTVVVYRQLSFMQNHNLGIDKHNVMILQNTTRLGNNMNAFKEALSRQPGIVKTSYINNSFPGVNNTTVFHEPGDDVEHLIGLYYADYDHRDVMRFELIEGRYFSPEFPSDSNAVLLNEAAIKEFGWEHPIGQELTHITDNEQVKVKVIGVVNDFNFESLKDRVRPLAIRFRKTANQIMIRYTGSSAEIVSTVGKLWKEQSLNEPFEYTFLDENFDELFRAEQRMSYIFGVFSALAIFVACLGLFALAAFTSEQRTKEIGIRKAMGASVVNLTLLLSKEFTMLVLVAFVPASILGWWVVSQWLEGFVYRIAVDPLIFIWSGVIAIIISWITVGVQALKAASANPVNSLRYE